MTQGLVFARYEFGNAELGDKRRVRRLVMIAAAMINRIGAAVSNACGPAGALAASRFFRRKEATHKAVLKPHIERTKERCEYYDRILAVQDTTILDYSTHRSTRGLGPVTTAEHSIGLLMHTVMAFSMEGTPLGILGQQIWAREESARGSRRERRKHPVSEKESNKWLSGLKQAQEGTCENQEVLVVGDRESDIYALFAASRRSNVELLVRIAHNRALAGEEKEQKRIFDALERAEVVGEHEVEVPRQGTRQERKAALEVRVVRVRLKSPRNGVDKHSHGEIEVSLIRAQEKAGTDIEDPLDWILLCTERIEGLDSAIGMIRAYTRRWGIEEFHRVLKSGCKVERIQFNTAEAMLPVIAVLSGVAWRVLYLTKQARSSPETDASEVASEEEIEVLSRWLEMKRKRAVIRTVKEFVRSLAMLGGFLGRKNDGEPGTKTIWQGLQNLEPLIIGYRIALSRKM